jgi:hypothetical protein
MSNLMKILSSFSSCFTRGLQIDGPTGGQIHRMKLAAKRLKENVFVIP